MNKTCISAIKNRTLIKVSGNDAEKFLQDILTCNVETIPPDGMGFGGLLTPQGKILFDFFIVRTPYGFLLDMEESLTADLMKRLNFYRLRAEVEFDIHKDKTLIFSVWGDIKPTSDCAMIVPDPRLPEMGWRLYASTEPDIMKNAVESDYNAHRITLGMPEGGTDYRFGATFPHEALYDQIGGVDFFKGCYIGQEVISRIQHRGTARKRILQIKGQEALPDTGAKITVSQKNMGEITSVSKNMGLANLRLDHMNEAIQAGARIMAEDIPIIPLIQPWTNIRWPARS